MAYVQDAAVLSGQIAQLAGVALRDLARKGYFDRVAPHARAELLAAIGDLERAGRARKRPDLPNGSSETPIAEIGRSSPLSADQVAALLGLTARRVRQLAAELGGRLERGRWVFERDAVAAEAARRREG